jgi:hypothetical protein
MLQHLAAVDLKALAELDLSLVDQLPKPGLALEQGQLTKVLAV